MPDRFRTNDVARATDVYRRQLDVLIARETIIPEHTPELGEARLFTEDEAVRIAILGEVLRCGVPAVQCADIVRKMYFLAEPFALVLWHGFAELMHSSPRGEPPPKTGGPNAVYVRPSDMQDLSDRAGKRFAWEVLPMSRLAEFLDKPTVAGAVVVPRVDRIIDRVKTRLSKATSY